MPIQQIGFQGRPPVFTWATKPEANAVPVGYTITIPEFSHSDWYSDGTYWRPVGGRQVLASRVLNPITVQSLNDTLAETIGPFPGGLVRAGMRLELDWVSEYGGVGGDTGRAVRAKLGSTVFWHSYIDIPAPASGGTKGLRLASHLGINSDGNGLHRRFTFSPNGYSAELDVLDLTMNFSSPWSVLLSLQGAAETAVAISSATWAGGVATINTAANHTLAVGDKTVIAGVTPTGWNISAGAIVLSVPTTTQFTVALAADPGAYTSGGTSSRISNAVSRNYVLELVG